MMWFVIDAQNVRSGPLSQAELEQRVRSGEIGVRDLLWRKGMKEWVRVADSEFAVYVDDALLRAVKPITRRILPVPKLEDVMGLVRTMKVLFWVWLALQVMAMVLLFWEQVGLWRHCISLQQWQQDRQAEMERFREGGRVGDEVLMVMVMLFQLLFVVMFVAQWFRWQLRTARNVGRLCGKPLRYPPLLGVFSWLIPVVFWVLPYLVLKELVERIEGTDSLRLRRLGWMWCAWVASSVLGTVSQLALQGYSEGDLSWMGLAGPMWCLAGMLLSMLVSAFCWYRGVQFAQGLGEAQLRYAARCVAERG